MKRHLITSMFVAACLVCGSMAEAKVQLPSIISDNMVLQQQTDAALWGTAEPGAKVTVKASWDKKAKYSTTADKETGRWMLKVATPEAGGPYEIRISDGEAVTLKNVLIGEVWFCSGQSNMEMPMKGYGSQPALGSEDVIVGAKASRQLRICNVSKQSSTAPKDSCEAVWNENTPEAVANTSATAYYFADALQAAIDVPVGIIVSCWGGTPINTWMSREVIEKEFPNFSTLHLDGKAPMRNNFQEPCLLYNGMVHPLEPYTFKGMIWYQGEADLYNPDLYIRMQKSYVEMMREKFQVPEAPFYFVQIAPWWYGNTEGDHVGKFNVAQQKSLSVIPFSGMAPTCDIGECYVIHPRNKQAVGKRLAFQALTKNYGFDKAIEADGPAFKSVEYKDGKAFVKFSTRNGLSPLNEQVSGFEVAGADKIFHPAEAYVRENGIVEMSCAEVPEPVAVRYCFRNWCVGTVFNCSGIPALPFRTDDWE